MSKSEVNYKQPDSQPPVQTGEREEGMMSHDIIWQYVV